MHSNKKKGMLYIYNVSQYYFVKWYLLVFECQEMQG